MPSPFPGMDPYLEDPAGWPNVHVNLITVPYGDYFVHVSRAERRPAGKVWPIRLPQPLPTIPIPLRAGDPDAQVDLQQTLTAVYDRSSYDLTIDYRGEPVPALPPEYARWADGLLKDSRLR